MSYDLRGIHTPPRKIRAPYCIWCGAPPPRNKRTTEHLIPQWVLRSFPEFTNTNNEFTACQSCNGKRGAMPPALYASVRGNTITAGALAKAHSYWGAVAQSFGLSGYRGSNPLGNHFRAVVLSDFAALIPKETGIYDPRADFWPKETLGLCSRSPTKDEWVFVAQNYPNRAISKTVGLAANEPWYMRGVSPRTA